MLVMKVVDKEFLFLSTYPLLFWNRSPKKKLNTSFFFFSSLLATTTTTTTTITLVHSHMKFTSNNNRYILGSQSRTPEPVVCATSLSLPLKEKLPCSASDSNIQCTIIVH